MAKVEAVQSVAETTTRTAPTTPVRLDYRDAFRNRRGEIDNRIVCRGFREVAGPWLRDCKWGTSPQRIDSILGPFSRPGSPSKGEALRELDREIERRMKVFRFDRETIEPEWSDVSDSLSLIIRLIRERFGLPSSWSKPPWRSGTKRRPITLEEAFAGRRARSKEDFHEFTKQTIQAFTKSEAGKKGGRGSSLRRRISLIESGLIAVEDRYPGLFSPCIQPYRIAQRFRQINGRPIDPGTVRKYTLGRRSTR